MWERFSYYGMRALLVLFLVDQTRGGFGLSDSTATAIYAIYTAGVYLACLPGGWISDRLLGAQRSVWFGGILIAAGHFTIAIHQVQTFYLGLLLIVLGTGLLKPNISALVADLYPEGGGRRDAGFTIFYMGINIGAALGPAICSALGEKIDWRYGFGAAGIGMILGLIQFHFTKKHLGSAGLQPSKTEPLAPAARWTLIAACAALVLFTALALTGAIQISPRPVAGALSRIITALAIAYFAIVLIFYKLDRDEKKRVALIAILFVGAALFWAGFEQVGSSFNLFAKRHTQLTHFGYEFPAGWLQSLGPILIITLAPVVASIWVVLAKRNANPSIPVKFGLGLLLLACGFIAMYFAAKIAATGALASPNWLITTYLLHTIGELCLSPVGLSSVTKLSPKRLVGQMMGTWFLGAALGNLIAGLLAGNATENVAEMPGQFLQMALAPTIAGLLFIILAGVIRKKLANVE